MDDRNDSNENGIVQLETPLPQPVDQPSPFDSKRYQLIQRVILTMGILIIIAGIVNVVLFFSFDETPSMLVVAGGQLAALLILLWSNRLLHQKKLDAAGYWTLLALLLALTIGEFGHFGAVGIALIGGTAALVLVGQLTLPGKWLAWLLVSLAHVVLAVLINSIEPFPRLSILGDFVARWIAPVAITILLAVLIWRILEAFRMGTIRTRLRISFIVAVLVPVILIGSFAAFQGFNSEQDRAQAQLELAVTAKADQIDLWIEQLYTTLDNVFANDEIQIRAVQLLNTPSPTADQLQRSDVLLRFRDVLVNSELFSEIFLLDRDGVILLSTEDTNFGASYVSERFFSMGQDETYLQPAFTSDVPEHEFITIVQPVQDIDLQTVGVLGARINLAVLDRVIAEESMELGETGETYLVGKDNRLLTKNMAGDRGDLTRISGTIRPYIESGGSGRYDNYNNTPVIGVFQWIPELEVTLIAEQAQVEAFQPVQTTLIIVSAVALLSLGLAVIIALFVTQSIADPLTQLAETATQIADGNLQLTAVVEREDETSELASAFNSMTGQLRGLITSLEDRVTARTKDLEQRSGYLEAAADVGRVVSSILEADQLIRQVVELIRQRFNLYYVGLFLVDDTKEWAILRAGTGEAGQAMMSRGHRIRVGEGMVGWSVQNAEARIVLDAGEDAVRLATAELPETRSEAAIPLRSRGRVIGAFTVQDSRPEAFDHDTIAVFQTMADQVAVALDNARLFTQSQEALDTAQRAYGDLSGQAWSALLQVQKEIGFQSTEKGLFPLQALRTVTTDEDRPKLESNSTASERQPLILPISVRGKVIGTLDTFKPSEQAWTPEEISLLETIVDQLGVALDNARLYEDSQRRAARERLVRQITDKVRTAADIDTIAQTAAEELGKALGTKQSFVSLASQRSRTKGNGHK